MRLIGEYSKQRYVIWDLDERKEVYWAGNSPLCSKTLVHPDDGLPITTMERFCIQTGNALAAERDAEFLGCEKEEL